MPFTFSHPAAALPFLWLPQRWRSDTGLIIGSMTPDFDKFLRMSEHDPYSHTWRSIFYFNLPLGLLLAFVFQLLIRDALITHLPVFLRQRFSPYLGFQWKAHFKRHYGVVIGSLLVGTVSHLVWDSFTHKGGWGVRLFPVLERTLIEAKDNLYFFELMQTATSIIGAGLVLYFCLKLDKHPARAFPSAKNLFRYLGTMALLWFVLFGLKAVLGEGIAWSKLNEVAITGISCGLLSLTLVSAYVRKRIIEKL